MPTTRVFLPIRRRAFWSWVWRQRHQCALRAHAEYDDFFDLYWDLNRGLKGALDARGIDIPFRSVVRHVGAGPEAGG